MLDFCHSADVLRPALIRFSHLAGSLFRQFPQTSPRESGVCAGYTRNAPGARDPETHLNSKSISTRIFKLESDLNGNFFAETFWGWELKENVHDILRGFLPKLLNVKGKSDCRKSCSLEKAERRQQGGKQKKNPFIGATGNRHFILNCR